MDPKLVAAVGESVAWYDDVFEVHGLKAERRGGLWVATGPTPPWHSRVKTLMWKADTDEVAAACPEGTVADSYGDQPLDQHGFQLLIDATWWWHDAPEAVGSLPAGWTRVTDRDVLAEWTEAHDYADVLTPPFLDHPRFVVLARHHDGELRGGAVLHDGPEAVGLSNTWGDVAWDDLLAAAGAVRPGRPLVGYDAEVPDGATALGPQRVWLR